MLLLSLFPLSMNCDTSIGDIAAVLLGAVTSSWIDRGCSFSSCSVASPETNISLRKAGFSKLSSKEPSYSVEDTDSSCLWLVIDFKREVKGTRKASCFTQKAENRHVLIPCGSKKEYYSLRTLQHSSCFHRGIGGG